MLPDIFHGFVITTNYDRILEKVYRDNNNSFEEVSYHIDESDRMNELGQEEMLKTDIIYLKYMEILKLREALY